MNNAKPHSKSIKLRPVDSNSEINPLNLLYVFSLQGIVNCICLCHMYMSYSDIGRIFVLYLNATEHKNAQYHS